MSAVVSVLALLAVPVAIGLLIAHNTLGRLPSFGAVGKLALGTGLGLGLCGVASFLSLLLLARITLVFEILLLAAVLAWTLKKRQLPSTGGACEAWTPALRALALVAVFPVILALVALVIQFPQQEYGGWDAWDFWNMRARFFARGGEHWWRSFTQISWWTHPEYPVLLPSMVARGFGMLSGEPSLVPMTVAAAFTLATPALLFFGVASLRGATQGILAALTLLVTPFFLYHGSTQYADVPLSFFFLATLVLIGMHDHLTRSRGSLLALAGCTAALAAFTKNEGIMFVACLAVARLLVVGREQGKRELQRQVIWFGVGFAPVGGALAIFKAAYAVMPDNAEFYAGRWRDWDRSLTEHIWTQLTTSERYVGFVETWWHNLRGFDERPVPLVFVLVGYSVLVGLARKRPRRVIRTLWLTLALQFVGVSALFLWWSTYPIREHMDATNRLLLQVLPMCLFGLFSALRAPWGVTAPEAPEAAEPVRP